MSEYLIYLDLPLYLAQWYADECSRIHQQDQEVQSLSVYRFPEPVRPVRGSQEADIIEYYLDKQPQDNPDVNRDNATIAIAVPFYKHKDPRTYNYLSPSAKQLLAESIRKRFTIQLWQYMVRFEHTKLRRDLLLESFMTLHHIDVNSETNCLAVAKIYQRKKKIYQVAKSRKKLSTSQGKNSHC